MAIAAKHQRPHFEESDFDDAEYYPHFAKSDSGPNLPPVEFKVEDIADSASPEAIIHAAIDERAIGTIFEPDATFGPVVIPSEKTLYGYKYALGSSGQDIRFSHKLFPLFDGVIVSASGIDASDSPTRAAFSPRSEYYAYYSPLRRNIAILRNYLMGLYPVAQNKLNQATLKAMAQKLGEALYAQSREPSFIQRIIDAVKQILFKQASAPATTRFLELANTPDRGIAFMYQYLLQQQADPAFLEALPAAQLPHDWKLVPLEECPFSASNIAQYSDASRMSQIAGAFAIVTRNLKSVDSMTPKDKEISVEHARDILKNLRILQTGTQEEKQYDAMDPRCRDAQAMLSAALGLQGALAELARLSPDLLNDPLVLEASKAITKISSRVKQEEQSMLKQENRIETTPQPPQQQAGSKPKPEKEKQKAKETIHKLVFKFEAGISRVGEIRKTHHSKIKQASAMQQALSSKQTILPKALQEGQSTMSSPKIHQVSVSDPDLIEAVKKANEDKAIEQQKSAPGGQSLSSK